MVGSTDRAQNGSFLVQIKAHDGGNRFLLEASAAKRLKWAVYHQTELEERKVVVVQPIASFAAQAAHTHSVYLELAQEIL